MKNTVWYKEAILLKLQHDGRRPKISRKMTDKMLKFTFHRSILDKVGALAGWLFISQMMVMVVVVPKRRARLLAAPQSAARELTW